MTAWKMLMWKYLFGGLRRERERLTVANLSSAETLKTDRIKDRAQVQSNVQTTRVTVTRMESHHFRHIEVTH